MGNTSPIHGCVQQKLPEIMKRKSYKQTKMMMMMMMKNENLKPYLARGEKSRRTKFST